jgi:hypothetical protein
MHQAVPNVISLIHRADNHFINGTTLLSVAGTTPDRRDDILKGEKVHHIVKNGPMHLKGVWVPFERALDFANKEKITSQLFPLFFHKIGSLLYNPNPTAKGRLAAEAEEGSCSNIMNAEKSSTEIPEKLRQTAPFVLIPTPPTSVTTSEDSTWEFLEPQAVATDHQSMNPTAALSAPEPAKNNDQTSYKGVEAHGGADRSLETDRVPRYANQVREWIGACDNLHGHVCVPESISQRLKEYVPRWLIDTHERCIVPGLSAHRYLALSYTWPETRGSSTSTSPVLRTLLLHDANIADFQRPEFLSHEAIVQQIPMVIRHAIEFSHVLGERYLWVDRLCIVQNDLGDEGTISQVAKMDKIFAGAYLTIIAAAPEEMYEKCLALE